MRYLKAFFRYTWTALDGLRKVLHLLVLLLIFALIIVAATPRVTAIPQSAALLIAPQGELVEQYTAGAMEQALAQATGEMTFELRLRDVLEAIRLAKDDPRIKVIVLNLDGLTGGGIVKLEEVAAALREFRAAGKQVIAHGQSFDQQQYYLAAQADQIYLDPHGMVLINGFGYYSQYFKQALDKLGVTVNVFKAGKYKSAVEPFIRQDMSPEAREANQQWLGSLWQTYQERVTQARGLPAGALQDYAEQMVPALQQTEGDLAHLALDKKLVTELKTAEQVSDELSSRVGEDDDEHVYRHIDVAEYLAAQRIEARRQTGHPNKVAIVVAAGEIIDGDSTPGTIGGDSLARLLKQARHDAHIKAVVLRIDSPGGSVMASEVVRREVAALRAANKPVIASMSSTAASGGYYIAMDAAEIWADPATITGSIGVFGIVPTFDQTLTKLGINTDGLGTTSIADALRVDRPMSEHARQVFQLSVNHEYAQFVDRVASARDKSFADINAVAQGRVWSAADAVQQGLVDHLGLLNDAVKAAAAQAQLGNQYTEEYLEQTESWRDVLAQHMAVSAVRAAHTLAPQTQLMSVTPPLSGLIKDALRLKRMAARPGVYLYCACELH